MEICSQCTVSERQPGPAATRQGKPLFSTVPQWGPSGGVAWLLWCKPVWDWRSLCALLQAEEQGSRQRDCCTLEGAQLLMLSTAACGKEGGLHSSGPAQAARLASSCSTYSCGLLQLQQRSDVKQARVHCRCARARARTGVTPVRTLRQASFPRYVLAANCSQGAPGQQGSAVSCNRVLLQDAALLCDKP